MRALVKIAGVCALASLVSVVLSSQTVPSSANSPQAPRITNISGVTSIAGQPFSADLEIERTQTLADGSHIRTVQHDKLYRDSEGRMRQEIYGHRGAGPEELFSVDIVDPTANVSYLLQLGSHIARRNIVFRPTSPAPATPRPA